MYRNTFDKKKIKRIEKKHWRINSSIRPTHEQKLERKNDFSLAFNYNFLYNYYNKNKLIFNYNN